MLFNSWEFAVFLPVVFILYWSLLQKNLKLQNLFLIIASYVFYGWWNWKFLSLIFISSIADYVLGLLINKSETKRKKSIFLTLSLLINLGILGFFKYYNFFIDSFIDLSASFGIKANINSLNIILPVGISFYTFQTLSYSIDIYRGKFKPTKDIFAFFAFVSFFPQLVAGPIERAAHLLPQFQKKRFFSNIAARDGLRQILWGLIKKVVVADTLALYVNEIFRSGIYDKTPGLVLVLGAIFFTFQIYCDFSGYSDIAIGTAKLFGFELRQNFNYPFFSKSIKELWHRWHISLSTWFRDYVYISLGGSYVSTFKKVRNILITFIVSGLWHGANWTFVIWGGIHGLLYLPSLVSKKIINPSKIKWQSSVWFSSIQTVTTFSLLCFSFIFFRSNSVKSAINYISNMFCNIPVDIASAFQPAYLKSLIFVIILTILERIQLNKSHVLQVESLPKIIRYSIYLIALIVLIYLGQFEVQQQFIYFQF